MTRRRLERRSAPTLSEALEDHYDDLKAFVQRRVGDPALAADIVQEAWLRASSGEPRDKVLNVRAYLYRLTGNLATDRMRQERSRSRYVSGEPLPEEVPSAEPSPEQVVVGREELAILVTAVSELPERCREVFLLYRGEGLSMRDVSERLSISEKTVEKHIAKAMLHCRQRLRAAGRAV